MHLPKRLRPSFCGLGSNDRGGGDLSEEPARRCHCGLRSGWRHRRRCRRRCPRPSRSLVAVQAWVAGSSTAAIRKYSACAMRPSASSRRSRVHPSGPVISEVGPPRDLGEEEIAGFDPLRGGDLEYSFAGGDGGCCGSVRDRGRLRRRGENQLGGEERKGGEGCHDPPEPPPHLRRVVRLIRGGPWSGPRLGAWLSRAH